MSDSERQIKSKSQSLKKKDHKELWYIFAYCKTEISFQCMTLEWQIHES